MRPPAALLSAVLGLLSSTALADAPQATQAAVAPAAAAPRVDPGVLADPSSDRAFVLPTAQTQPAGTVSVSTYQVFLLGLTVGLHDRLQLSVTTPVPYGFKTGMASLKLQLVRTRRLRVSFLGGSFYSNQLGNLEQDLASTHHDGKRNNALAIDPFGGVIASLCVDEGCHSLLSGSLYGLNDGTRIAMASASLVLRASERTKVLLEYQGFRQLHTNTVFDFGIAAAGLRFFRSWAALDIGLLVALDDGDDLGPLPYGNATLRF